MYSVPLFGIVREKNVVLSSVGNDCGEGTQPRLFVKDNKWGQYPVRRFEIQVSYSNIRASTFDFDDFRVGKKDV